MGQLPFTSGYTLPSRLHRPGQAVRGGTTALAHRDPQQLRTGLSYLEMRRSEPPGMWSDDRWEQVRHFTGVPYIAIRAILDLVSGAGYQALYRRKKDKKRTTFLPGGTVAKAVPVPLGTRDDAFVPIDDPRHPVVKLLEKPNPVETFGELASQLILQNRLTGIAPLWAVPNKRGQPVELWALHTATTLPQTAARSVAFPHGSWRVQPYLSGGWFGALPGGMGATGCVLPGEEVKRFLEPHPFILGDGYAPLTAAAVQLDVLGSIDEARKAAMDHGVTLDAVLIAPGMDQALGDRVSETMAQKHGGSRNFRRFLTLTPPGGSAAGDKPSLMQLTTGAKDLDFNAGWDQMIKFCLAVFGVPPGVAGLASSDSYSKLYAELQQFHHQQSSFVQRFAAWLTKVICWPWGPDRDLRIQIDLPAPKDPELQERQLALDVPNGLVSMDQALAIRNRPPVPNGHLPPALWNKWMDQQLFPPQQPGAGGQPGAEQPGGAGAGQPDQNAASPPAPGQNPQETQGAGEGDQTDGDPLASLLGEGASDQRGGDASASSGSASPTQEATLRAALHALGLDEDNNALQLKAITVTKAGAKGAPAHREGEKFQVAGGHWRVIKNGKAVPTSAPTAQEAASPPSSGAKSAAPKSPQPAVAPGSDAAHDDLAKRLLGGRPELRLLDGSLKGHTIRDGRSLREFFDKGGKLPPGPWMDRAAESVPASEPQAKGELQRAHEWAGKMAAKHADRVARHFGISPEKARALLEDTIRKVAEHALKNGGKAAGTLRGSNGKTLRVGVKDRPVVEATGQRVSTGSAPSKPPQPSPAPQSRGGPTSGAPPRPRNPAGEGSRPPQAPRPDGASPDWAEVTGGKNDSSPPRGNALRRAWDKVKNGRFGRALDKVDNAFRDVIDRGVIVAGNDDERREARKRRALRAVGKSLAWATGEDADVRELFDLLCAEYPLHHKALTHDVSHEARDARGRWTGAGADATSALLDHAETSHERGLAQRARAVPAAIRKRVTSWLTKRYRKLAERYGPTGAKAVLAAMVALTPLPLPGSSLLPVAIAEAVLRIRRRFATAHAKAMYDSVSLSPAEVNALARELWADACDEFEGECGEMAADDEGEHKALAGSVEYADPAPYGFCPECREPGEWRHRHLGGSIFCGNGHEYTAKTAKYASTQVEVGGEARRKLLAMGEEIDPSDLGDDGVEGAPHVTALYGLHLTDAAPVAELVAGFGPVRLTLGRVKAFRGAESGKPYDVLVVEVESPDLVRLHDLLCRLPHTKTHPTYVPHCTIGYVKAGECDKYLARWTAPLNLALDADSLTFSTAKREHTIISLGGDGETHKACESAMNTLVGSDGGFLAASPGRKRKRKGARRLAARLARGLVAKALNSERVLKGEHAEGQKFQGAGGKWFVIRDGRAVPTAAPGVAEEAAGPRHAPEVEEQRAAVAAVGEKLRDGHELTRAEEETLAEGLKHLTPSERERFAAVTGRAGGAPPGPPELDLSRPFAGTAGASYEWERHLAAWKGYVAERYGDWGTAVPPEQRAAASEYERWPWVNAFLRAGELPDAKEVKANAWTTGTGKPRTAADAANLTARLDAAIDSAPPTDRPLALHRWLSVADDGPSRALYDALESGAIAPGHVLTDSGYQSTSYGAHIANISPYSENVVMRIAVPAGAKALPTEAVIRTSQGEDQREFVLPRGARYTVTGVRREGGTMVVDVDYQLPAGPPPPVAAPRRRGILGRIFGKAVAPGQEYSLDAVAFGPVPKRFYPQSPPAANRPAARKPGAVGCR